MLPRPAEILREAITVLAGAVVAALIIRQFPQLKRWVADSWKD